jgi:hypothetical protein
MPCPPCAVPDGCCIDFRVRCIAPIFDVGGKQPPEVRQTRAQRKQADREERHKEADKSMPTAMVCIAFESNLWPQEDKQFTDGVLEI